MKYQKLPLIGMISLAMASTAFAEVPHVFQSGDAAVASEVNENFSALDAAITNVKAQLPAELSTAYEMPFSDSGDLAARNVIVMERTRADHHGYFLRVRYRNTTGETYQSVNGAAEPPYVGRFPYINVDDMGNVNYMEDWAYSFDEPQFWGGGSLAISYFDTTNPSYPKTSTQAFENEFTCYGTPHEGGAQQCLDWYKDSSGETVDLDSGTRRQFVMSEPVAVNGMTFQQALAQETHVNGQTRMRIWAEGIGLVLDVVDEPGGIGQSELRKVVWYRVNGQTEGSLAGTPFAKGAALNGLFFTE